MVKEARIISLTMAPGDPNNAPVEASDAQSELPKGARLLQAGGTLEDLDLESLKAQHANVVFLTPGVARETLAGVMAVGRFLQQSRSSGCWTCISK